MGLGPSKVFCIYTTSEGVFKQLFPNSDEMCDDFDVANHYLHKIMSQVSPGQSHQNAPDRGNVEKSAEASAR